MLFSCSKAPFSTSSFFVLTLVVFKPCVHEVVSQFSWSCNDLYQLLTCASSYLSFVSLSLDPQPQNLFLNLIQTYCVSFCFVLILKTSL